MVEAGISFAQEVSWTAPAKSRKRPCGCLSTNSLTASCKTRAIDTLFSLAISSRTDFCSDVTGTERRLTSCFRFGMVRNHSGRKFHASAATCSNLHQITAGKRKIKGSHLFRPGRGT